eukprot:4157111-Heterocapsa_arctica.AAC.1
MANAIRNILAILSNRMTRLVLTINANSWTSKGRDLAIRKSALVLAESVGQNKLATIIYITSWLKGIKTKSPNSAKNKIAPTPQMAAD